MEEEKDKDISDDFELVKDEEESVIRRKGPEEAEEKLREKLKSCEGERQEYLNGWQRARADLINERKELEKQRVEFVKFANEDLILQLLPVVDSFETAMKEAKWKATDENWRDGIENIYRQMLAVLKDNKIEQLNPEGEIFDPKYHDSIEKVETENEDEDNKIIEVLQKGYKLHEQVIRPARVKVAQYKE